MNIRKSTTQDIDFMMELFHQAQTYFKSQGIDQWQDGYPSKEQILQDIQSSHSYVLIEQDKIIGTMFFSCEHDPTYDYIDGQWLTHNTPYAVIHRIVIDNNYKGQGIANILLEYAINQCQQLSIPSIRIDTHDDNQSMQSFLLKHGFKTCGHIYIASGAIRIAFEKLL